MLIYNAKIYTMSEAGVIDNGFILVENGKIARVGKMAELSTPPARDDFNAFGMNVYPGFIDVHTHLGMWEDGLGFEGADGNEITDPSTPQLRAIDGVNPNDYCFLEGARAGVTSILTGVGSANPVGGEFAAMKTFGSRRIDKRIIRSPAAIKFALGENPKKCYNDRDEAPTTRTATAAVIREQLYKTRRYMQDIIDYESSLGTENEGSMPDFDMKCEALMPLLKGKVKAHFHCHRADDIFTAVRLAKEFDIKCVLIHATEGGLIADELGEDGFPCVVGPVIADRCKPELSRQSIENAARLHKAGIDVAICTDHPENPIQYLPLAAGVCIKGGLDKEAALAAITIGAAKIAGIEDRVGSIEVGKDADIAVLDGEFYDVLTTAKLVLVDGYEVRL
ncbi:MAG: amidohydrolase family protein [Oscillospiraceae bacterium]|nr:amidohydrolase family protein [Oscillospiraceae bacterium]